MSMLKRNMAPMPSEIWNEIDERAETVLKNILSARKVVHVEGPMGWDYPVVSEGRLDIIDDNEDKDVSVGTYRVKALLEARISFELDRWELDNITRGAKDIDLEPLEEATKKLAYFEENLIYNGYKNGNVKGLNDVAGHRLNFGKDETSILDAISEARFLLMEAYGEKPYSLVVGRKAFKLLNTVYEGYPLVKTVSSIIDGNVILSDAVDGAFLIPFDHEDIELTIGQDFSIGYENHDDKKIKLFITESLTFRVLDEKLIVKFDI